MPQPHGGGLLGFLMSAAVKESSASRRRQILQEAEAGNGGEASWSVSIPPVFAANSSTHRVTSSAIVMGMK